MHSLITTGLILLGYLLGSLSSAIVVCKLMGLPDPRSAGSGNPGTTNVLRLAGKKAAAITLAGDMLKGLIPVLAGALAGLNTFQLALIAVAAVLGHRPGDGLDEALAIVADDRDDECSHARTVPLPSPTPAGGLGLIAVCKKLQIVSV